MCTFDDGPVRVSVDYDRIVDAHVVKVVRTCCIPVEQVGAHAGVLEILI